MSGFDTCRSVSLQKKDQTMDDKPKAITFGGEEHNEPLADISGLVERRKTELCRKAMSAFGTYNYGVFKSDEEFELALACLSEESSCPGKKFHDRQIAEYAAYHRGFYYHKKKFRVWKQEVLEPMVKSLADYALNSPHYYASFLLELEMRKMQCMDAYFSHSVTADENGNYPGGRWLRLCIKLLQYLTDEHSIPDEKILAINIRNIGYPVSQWDLDHFVTPNEDDNKLHYGRNIYWHKAHRLYCHIRQHALHTWWD